MEKKRNLWVIPTDKPSRLRYNLSNVLVLTKEPYRDYNKQVNQHLYITNDEEIKKGDWYITVLNNEIYKADSDTEIIMSVANKCDNTTYKKTHFKIILTTDPDLIKDGVQPIDDEFLEWFVKNSTCESVKIQLEVGSLRWSDSKNTYKIIIPKEEPKQETLEEAAEIKFNVFQKENPIVPKNHIQPFKLGFINGAKWQQEPEQFFSDDRVKILEKSIEYLLKRQERMYSEEDMRLAINKARGISDGKDCFDAEDISGCTEVCTYDWKFNMSEDSIIEQFKKK